MRVAGWILLLLLLVGGLLWLALGGQPDAPAPAGESPSTKDIREPPLLKTREGTAEALAEARRDDSEPDTEEQPEIVEGSAVRSWVEVRVRSTEDMAFNVTGRVYVLRAGAKDAEGTYELPGANVKAYDEPVRVPLLEPGRYDVGVVAEWGHALREDVEVKAGETVSVDLALPPLGVLQVHLNDDWPIAGFKNVRGFVMLDPVVSAPSREVPGRGEAHHPPRWCALWTDLQGAWIRPDLSYDARLRLVRMASAYANHVLVADTSAVGVQMEPARVKAGDRLQLGLPALMELPLHPRAVGPWAVSTSTTLKIEVYGPGWVSTHAWWRELKASDLAKKENATISPFALSGGAMHVRWSGSNVLPGKIEHVERMWRKGTPIELQLALAPSGIEEPLAVSADVVGPSPWTRVAAWDRKLEEPMLQAVLPKTGRRVLRATWRRYAGVVAFDAQGRISAPARIPAHGPLAFTWMQGGRIRFVGPDAYPDEAGPLLLRRKDREPFIQKGHVQWESYIEEGDVIGPLRPGPVEFDIHAGRKLLGTYRVIVRAGETRRLDIRR